MAPPGPLPHAHRGCPKAENFSVPAGYKRHHWDSQEEGLCASREALNGAAGGSPQRSTATGKERHHCKMARYSDEEDYAEEAPEFRDEQDLDDYLNDEEYALLNEVLPGVRSEMAEYQGYQALDLKLAIFDNEFDQIAAVKQLKRDFKKKKKKKKTSTPSATAPQPPSLSKTTQSLSNVTLSSATPSAQSQSQELDAQDSDDDEGRRNGKKRQEEEQGSAVLITPYKRAVHPTKPRKPVDIAKYVHSIARPHLSFVVLGHVDAGKSTLMGRLLYDIGAVDKNQIRKLKKESESIGKGSFHLAWVMDQTSEERERGVTVSICTSDFHTPDADFTIVDAPGHRDFVPNAIAGVSQADVAVLSVDCGTDAFESGFNLDGQTKEHALLARSMDISTIIVAMNKMDTVHWSAKRFFDIKGKLAKFFTEIGFNETQIQWVPLSGFSGEGVYKIPYPKEQSWYMGPSLVETLEEVARESHEVTKQDVLDKQFVFSILDVISSKKNDEVVVSGKVEAGSIQPGETITIYPSQQSVLVDKIIAGREQVNKDIAIKSDFVTLKLRKAHAEDIEGGDLAASVGYDIKSSRRFTVRLLTFQMNRPLLPGTSLMLFRGVYEQPARISKLISIVDKRDPSKVLKKKVRHLASNQVAVVEVELTEKRRWIPMLTFEENKHIGRIILRKDGRSVATGSILSLD